MIFVNHIQGVFSQIKNLENLGLVPQTPNFELGKKHVRKSPKTFKFGDLGRPKKDGKKIKIVFYVESKKKG